MADVLAPQPSGRSAAEPGGGSAERVAGPAQAVLLIAASSLSVLSTVLIAPLQPVLATEFATTPGVDVLVPLAVTMPAVMIVLLAPLAGRIADRAGRVRLLIGSLVIYAIFGTAPLWLPNLPLVVASRAGVGVAVAGIMTCCVALLADMWSGPARNRMMGLQVLVGSLSAVGIVAAGGALGRWGGGRRSGSTPSAWCSRWPHRGCSGTPAASRKVRCRQCAGDPWSCRWS